MTIITRWKPPKNPWERAELDDHDLAVLKVLKDKHPEALRVILVKLCRTYDMSFRPGGSEGDRATIFAEGMRAVGTALIEAIDRPMKPSGDPNASSSPNSTAESRRNPKPSKPASAGKPAKPASAR